MDGWITSSQRPYTHPTTQTLLSRKLLPTLKRGVAHTTNTKPTQHTSSFPHSEISLITAQKGITEAFCKMGSEMVMVDEIPFPPKVTTSKPLSLFGHGITDIEIHFLQIKFTAIGVYLDPEVISHLHQWKGNPGTALAEDDDFFEALISAPVEKFLRIVVIKEIKGSQYGVQLESAVRDRLAAEDKYEEEEEAELEKVVEFFQSKYLKKNSVITFHFPATSKTAEIGFSTEGKEEVKVTVGNGNVVEMIKRWYLGGTRGISQTTISCLANNISSELSK